jgi:hypothetical protein
MISGTIIKENTYLEDWTMLVIAAFLLLSLGIMLGMFLEKSLKKLTLLAQSFDSYSSLPTSNLSSTVSQSQPLLKDLSKEQQFLPPIDRSLVPKHIAVIMDGNRRFGKLTRSDPLQVFFPFFPFHIISFSVVFICSISFRYLLLGSLGWWTNTS